MLLDCEVVVHGMSMAGGGKMFHVEQLNEQHRAFYGLKMRGLMCFSSAFSGGE
jgi:hypothetical protein